MKKINITIENCTDCPYYQLLGGDMWCNKIGDLFDSDFAPWERVNEECPIGDAEPVSTVHLLLENAEMREEIRGLRRQLKFIP